MMPNFAIVCTKSFYAGQGVSFEEGQLKETTYTIEEAKVIYDSLLQLAYGDTECWSIMSYEEYHKKFYDDAVGQKASEKLKKIKETRFKCKKPHEYNPPETRSLSSSWICSKCGDELEANCASWYMNGRKDQKELE